MTRRMMIGAAVAACLCVLAPAAGAASTARCRRAAHGGRWSRDRRPGSSIRRARRTRSSRSSPTAVLPRGQAVPASGPGRRRHPVPGAYLFHGRFLAYTVADQEPAGWSQFRTLVLVDLKRRSLLVKADAFPPVNDPWPTKDRRTRCR